MNNILENSNTNIFLMSDPFYTSSEEPNNIWMEEMSKVERKIDLKKAFFQWRNLYNFISGQSVCYLLPSVMGLQDQVYVANVGVILSHLENVAVIANFKAEQRIGESQIGEKFLQDLGFKTFMSPEYFEGEADLKHLSQDIYLGAYGIRTSMNSLDWFENEFSMKVLKIRMQDPYLYHLDCVVFPLSSDSTLICTDVVEKETTQEIERHTEVILVPREFAYAGITNCLRLGKMILCSSDVEELSVTDDRYIEEKNKINFLEKVCGKYGFEPVIFNLSEFMKSGAMLSCCVMTINSVDYRNSNI